MARVGCQSLEAEGERERRGGLGKTVLQWPRPVPIPAALWPRASLLQQPGSQVCREGEEGETSPPARALRSAGPWSVSAEQPLSHPCCRRHMSARGSGKQLTRLIGSHTGTINFYPGWGHKIRHDSRLLSKMWLRETSCAIYNRTAFERLSPPGLRVKRSGGQWPVAGSRGRRQT